MYMIYATGSLSHLKKSRPDFYQDYITEGRFAILIHYAGPRKAWHYPQLPFADLWWELARKTPFYERFLADMHQFQTSATADHIKNHCTHLAIDQQKKAEESHREQLRAIVLSSKQHSIKLRYAIYRLFSKISSGALRKKLLNKRQKMKAQLDLLKKWAK